MRLSLAIVVAALLAVPAAAQVPGGYAGQQARDIKALSAQEQADLLAGRGMGFARAAELNHYPGPAHVLELKEKLGLSPRQVSAVQASFGRMQGAAKKLGAQLVARERDLDTTFRAGTLTPTRMAAETGAIGVTQGRLRAVHLAAHLEMRTILTAAQIATYDALRGYADGLAAPDTGHHHPG